MSAKRCRRRVTHACGMLLEDTILVPCSYSFLKKRAISYVVLHNHALSIQGSDRLPNEESQRGGFLPPLMPYEIEEWG
jgi:hypothetical protein